MRLNSTALRRSNICSAAGGLIVGASPTESNRTSTRPLLRTAALFLILWVPGTTLDVITTEIARRQGDWVELNPTGFVPLSAAVVRELIVALVTTGVVLGGAWFRRDALRSAAVNSGNQFWEALFERRAWAIPLFGIPIFAAIGRYGVVVSNACYLALGWSPIDAVLLLPLQALFRDDALGYVVSQVIGIVVLWYPFTALTFRLLYAVNGGGRHVEPGAAADTGRL